ncbi:hypothetical protein OG21DRAFT_1486292 [Imleria badia]|nr:hypothetical protein OG21DRAFT_1486292 [Imleria badia]
MLLRRSVRFCLAIFGSIPENYLSGTQSLPLRQDSRPYQLRDGDVLQLGVDYQGGSEDIYKSVKIKIEYARHRPKTHERANNDPQRPTSQTVAYVHLLCLVFHPLIHSLGLFSVTVRRAFFIAPCSHAFHYKFIRPLLEKHASAFFCTLCRSFADLNENIDWEDMAGAAPSAPHILHTISVCQLASPAPLARDGAETEAEGDVLDHHRPRRSRPPFRTDGQILRSRPWTPSSMRRRVSTMGFVTRGLGFGLPLPGKRDYGSEGSAEGVVLAGTSIDPDPRMYSSWYRVHGRRCITAPPFHVFSSSYTISIAILRSAC